MNERIKELAKQATEEVMRDTPSFLVTNEMWQEKFAELIVRECLSYAKDGDIDFMKFMIKQHFGVEE